MTDAALPPDPPCVPDKGHVPSAPTREPGRRHVIMLLLACAVIVAAFGLQVLPDGDGVSIREVSVAKLPPLCVARPYLGVKCPGCGLTRSFVYLAHGDVWSSIR